MLGTSKQHIGFVHFIKDEQRQTIEMKMDSNKQIYFQKEEKNL
jgi:hypothetical protein